MATRATVKRVPAVAGVLSGLGDIAAKTISSARSPVPTVGGADPSSKASANRLEIAIVAKIVSGRWPMRIVCTWGGCRVGLGPL